MRLKQIPGLLVLAPALAIVTACATQQAAAPTVAPTAPAADAAPTALTPAAPVLAPTAGIAARERFQLAINLLQQGNPAQARLELTTYIAETPNSPQARYLLNQIDTPIEMLFPADNFTVQLGRDETLSTLAGVFLGDVLGFYSLARYNGIQVPGRVREGQAIKIPRTPQALAALMTRPAAPVLVPPAGAAPGAVPAAPPAQAARPRDPWAIIREEATAGRYANAIREAETSRVTPDRAQAALLASAYLNNAKATRAANAAQAGAQALRAGQLYDTADRPDDAFEAAQLAVAITPTDMRAQTLLASARTKATDVHYRNGQAAFQRQDLDGAIAEWNRVLAIDPNHRNAQLSRAQAQELKENLSKLR